MSGRQNTKGGRQGLGPVARLLAALGRPIIRHLSDLACESLNQPGSWRCLEIVYRNEPRTLLDRFLLGSHSARGARNRLHVLQEEMNRCIEEHSRIHNPVKLVSYGSGPGHEILGCLESFRDKVAIEATCIDRDVTALAYGKSLAAKKGVGGYIEYVQGNVLRTDNDVTHYHAAVISGVLDYYNFETAVSMLQMVGRQLEPNGTVLIANMRPHYLASTMSILGNWNLIYREPEEVESILAKSGYEEIKVWLEPEKVFCIGMARKPR